MQCVSGNFMVRKWQQPAADFLRGFVPLAGDENHIGRRGFHDGRANRVGALDDRTARGRTGGDCIDDS